MHSQSNRFWQVTEWEQLMPWLTTGPPLFCFGPQAPTSRWRPSESRTNPDETLWLDWETQRALQCILVPGECPDLSGLYTRDWLGQQGNYMLQHINGFTTFVIKYHFNILFLSFVSLIKCWQLLVLVWLVPSSGHHERLHWWQQCCSSGQHNTGMAIWALCGLCVSIVMTCSDINYWVLWTIRGIKYCILCGLSLYIHWLIDGEQPLTGWTGCTGRIPSWTRLATLALKAMTDRRLQISARSLNPTLWQFIQVGFLVSPHDSH